MRSLELTYTHCYIQHRYLGKDLLYSTGLLRAQSCPTLCDPMDCSPSGPSVHGSFHTRILAPFPPPGDLPDPGIKTVSPVSPALADGFFTSEPPGEPIAQGTRLNILY